MTYQSSTPPTGTPVGDGVSTAAVDGIDQIADRIMLDPPIRPRAPGETLGPVKVQLAPPWRPARQPSVTEEAQDWLWGPQRYAEIAAAELDEAEAGMDPELPLFPDACRELDLDTGKIRGLSRAEMWTRMESSFPNQAAIWLERVIAYDRFHLKHLEVEARWKHPQLEAAAIRTADSANDMLGDRVLTARAKTPREAAIKLGLILTELRLLNEEDSAPLRRLFAELAAMGSVASVPMADAA